MTPYTATTLAEYMHTVLADSATALGWSVAAGSYAEPVNEVTLACGVDDLSQVDDVRKVRALARQEVWRQVMNTTALDYTYSDAGGSYNRQQLYEHARQSFLDAEQAARQYDPSYQLSAGTITWTDDPTQYRWQNDENW